MDGNAFLPFAFYLFLIAIPICDAQDDPQRDRQRYPQPFTTTQTPIAIQPIWTHYPQPFTTPPSPIPIQPTIRPHHPQPFPATQTPIPFQPTIQVLGIPIAPALNLAGGIVGSVLAATRPREPEPLFEPFSCAGRVPGYYADVNTHCKNYYACTPHGRQYYFRCGEHTIFNQLYLTCDHRRNYDCRRALQDYSVNEQYRPFRRPIDDDDDHRGQD